VVSRVRGSEGYYRVNVMGGLAVSEEGEVIGQENVYTCPDCGGYTVTIDVDDGVTPFLLGCRASGRAGDCKGMAQSAFYPKGPRPFHFPPPAWEWYRPTEEEFSRLNPGMKDHVRNGGLDIRRKKDSPR
jgi:hypothetical protein